MDLSPRRFRFWIWLIRLIGVIVPRRLRVDWRQEWEGELRCRELRLAEWERLSKQNKLDLLWRSTSAFWDAMWLQTHRWEDAMIQDLRFGVRMLLKHSGFTMTAVFTLAIGIGVNTALFTVFDALVFKPLPVKDPDGLVNFSGVDQNGGRHKLFSYVDYLDYRDRNTTLTDLVAWNKAAVIVGEAQEGRDDISEGAGYIFGQLVSANYFSVLGAEMALGRGFLPDEDRTPGAHSVIVLSHHLWQQQFEGDPNVIGKIVKLQSHPFTVIGVTASDFVGTTPDNAAFWVPLMMRDQVIPLGLGERHDRWLNEREADSFALFGRMKFGVVRGQARAEMSLIAQQLARQYPGKERKTIVEAKSAASFINLEAKQLGFVVPVIVAFGLVLLIACANVTNLLLARAASRQKEIAVKLALGASRPRVIRQLLTESVLISAIGGLAGLLAASWTLRTLHTALLTRMPELPAFIDLKLDYRIFGFTLLLVLIAGLAAGLAPALQSSRPDLNSALKDEGSTFGQHLRQSGLRDGLIVTQVAVSLALLIGAGLLVRNLQKAPTIDTGFQPEKVLSVALNTTAGDDVLKQGEIRRRLAERLSELPGVTFVSNAFRQPSSGQLSSTRITIAGQTDEKQLQANYNFVSPKYFDTLGIQLVRGRCFTEQEANAGAPVVVISESTAKRFWPDQEAIGQHLGIAAAIRKPQHDPQRETPDIDVFPSYEVIGIAHDTRSGWVWEKDQTLVYVPLGPDDRLGHYILVRTEGDPRRLMASLQGEVEAIDPDNRIAVQRTSDYIAQSMTPFRLLAGLAGVLGSLALLLASIGLYGVISFSSRQRTREIAVRLALGAQRGDIVRLFLREGLRLTSKGFVLGLAGGLGVGKLLEAILIDVTPLDPIAFGVTSVLLTAVALLATYLPARHAMKADPMTALRHD